MAAWPVVAAAEAWSAGENPSFVLALIGVALAAVPAAATAFGLRGARKLAEGFALAGLVIAIVVVLRNGVSLSVVPAAGYFVVYAFLWQERSRQERAAASKEYEVPPLDHPLSWLKENVEAIAVAFIMALVIRCFCIEVFKIPSSSMEPTSLIGDRIMVSKLAYALQDPDRFECAVFKFPLNPMKNYIKRIVGLPGEELVLFRGNVYARPLEGGDRKLRIQRKTLKAQRTLWIPAWSRQDGPLLQNKKSFEDRFTPDRAGTTTVRDGVLSGGGPGKVLWIASDITDRHLLTSPGDPWEIVNDVAFDALLNLQAGPGRFWIRFEHDLGPFELSLSTSGASALYREGKPHPLKTAAFPAGKDVRVEFLIFDGQAVVLFDGRVQAELVFQETLDDVYQTVNAGSLRFGADDARFTLSGLHVGQDIYHKPPRDVERPMTRERPLRIPPGKYFMLGDNVNNSHDGRAWKKRTILLRNGTKVVYESSNESTDFESRKAWADRNGKSSPPDLLIREDENGHEWALDSSEIERREPDEPYEFVESRFLIGRAFAVCWPLSRSFRRIR